MGAWLKRKNFIHETAKSFLLLCEYALALLVGVSVDASPASLSIHLSTKAASCDGSFAT